MEPEVGGLLRCCDSGGRLFWYFVPRLQYHVSGFRSSVDPDLQFRPFFPFCTGLGDLLTTAVVTCFGFAPP